MPRRDQAIDDGVNHIAMGGEQLAAGRGNLDPNLVVRRNERAPGTRPIALAGHGQEEAVHHYPNCRWVGPVILDCGGIVRRVDDRAARLGGRILGKGRSEAAEKKQS